MECLDAASGVTLWRHAYPSTFVDPYGYNNGPRATPLLTPSRCFTFGAEGHLVCLDLATGSRIWSRDTAQDWDIPEAFFGVGSSPILQDNRLIVMVGGQPNSGVVALDPETGETLWEAVGRSTWEGQPMLGWPGEPLVAWRSSVKQASYATPVAAIVGDRPVVFCLMRQGLVALSPTDGQVLFSRWFRARVNESVNAANPIVAQNQIFFSAAYYRVGSVSAPAPGLWTWLRHPRRRQAHCPGGGRTAGSLPAQSGCPARTCPISSPRSQLPLLDGTGSEPRASLSTK